MRFLVAALLFVISVCLLLVGLGQRTIWAPPANIAQDIQIDSAKPLLMIPNEVLRAHKGNPTIYVHGSDQSFIATGREADIQAWIGNSAFNTIKLENKALAVSPTEGAANLDSPVGSDMWRSETKSKGSAELLAKVTDEGAVLVASDGIKPTGKTLSIVWPIPYDLTWSNILMISGGVILIAAIVLNQIAYHRMRRSRGPRRRTPPPPKPPRYRAKKAKNSAPARGRRSARRAFIAIPIAVSLLGATTACSQSTAQVTASPSPSASANDVPPPALLQSQVNRIVADVARITADADLTSDKKVLAPRYAGPALDQRTAHYIVRSRSQKIAALPPIVGSPITFSLPAATDAWPRTLMVVTDDSKDSQPPQMLVFEQDTPRSKYMLWYNIALMPGAKIPEVPGPEQGAIPVANNSLFLKVSPTSLASAYGDVINKGPASLSYGLFDLKNDEFYQQVAADQATKIANKAGKITFGHALGNKNTIALATRAAGALVAVYMNDTYTIKPKNRTSAIAVSGAEKVMLGSDGSTRGIRSVYGDMLLFYVPALSDTAGIRLLGVTQGLVSVRSL